MRALEDAEVEALAATLRDGGTVLDWPADYAAQLGVPDHVCAMLNIQGDNVMVALNDRHECTRPDQVMLHVAALVLAYVEQGPDESWQAYGDGSGHQTFISEPGPGTPDPGPAAPAPV